jgi:ubiquitin carboxyl-terminal hydrolase L5
MAEDPSGWSLTESDPQVFTQLLRELGVKGLQVVRGIPAWSTG